MAFFKFRKNGTEQSGPGALPESLEALRKRARHRLIGAAFLVLLGVVGFPLLFDSQPRPIAVDIAINIPDKSKTAPLGAASASTPVAAVAPSAANTASAALHPDNSASGMVPATAPPATALNSPPKPEAKAEAKTESKADKKALLKSENKPGDKAQALLEGKDPGQSAVANAPRFTVQVGAFADVQKANEARMALEKAGIKTYTQVVVTANGKRTRVRAGPWEDRAEAEKTAEKIKKLNLPAAVLSL